uniref:Uncharacterized protein n=1 Tax=Lotharella oceanica TaxID=641309 RepID=A0A7S2TFI2_9EUKA
MQTSFFLLALCAFSVAAGGEPDVRGSREPFWLLAEAANTIGRLRELANSDNVNIDLPTIVACGVTSVGKTTFIQHLIPIPVGYSAAKTATRCPVLYELIKSNKSTTVQVGNHDCGSNALEASNRVMMHMNMLERRDEFSSQPLRVKIEGRDVSIATSIIDMPGLVTREEKIEQIDDINRLYINNPNNMLLVINEAQNAIDNMYSLHRVQELFEGDNDQLNQRMILVLSKTNKLTDEVEDEHGGRTIDEFNEHVEALNSLPFPAYFTSAKPLYNPEMLRGLTIAEAKRKQQKAEKDENNFFKRAFKEFPALSKHFKMRCGINSIAGNLMKKVFTRLQDHLPNTESTIYAEYESTLKELSQLKSMQFTTNSSRREYAIDYVTQFCENFLLAMESGAEAKSKKVLKRPGFTFAEEYDQFLKWHPRSKNMWTKQNGFLSPGALREQFVQRNHEWEHRIDMEIAGSDELSRLLQMFEAMVMLHRYKKVNHNNIAEFASALRSNTDNAREYTKATRDCATYRAREIFSEVRLNEWSRRKIQVGEFEHIMQKPMLEIFPRETEFHEENIEEFEDDESDEALERSVNRDMQLQDRRSGTTYRPDQLFEKSVSEGTHATTWLMHMVQTILLMLEGRAREQTLEDMPSAKLLPDLCRVVNDRFVLEIRKILGEATSSMNDFIFHVTSSIDSNYWARIQKIYAVMWPNSNARESKGGLQLKSIFEAVGRLLQALPAEPFKLLGIETLKENQADDNVLGMVLNDVKNSEETEEHAHERSGFQGRPNESKGALPLAHEMKGGNLP